MVAALTVEIRDVVARSGVNWDESLLPYDAPEIPDQFKGEMQYQWWNKEHDAVTNQSVYGPDIYHEFHRKGFVVCLWHFDQDVRYSREGVRWNMIDDPLHFFNYEGSGYPGPHDKALFLSLIHI